MATDVTVVSLGRVLADQVRVDATEAYAVLQQAWRRIRATRDDDGGMVPVPALDAMGVTPFGDFEVRQVALSVPRTVRPPHHLAHDLATLLLHLLSSGRPDLDEVPAACVDAARRATSAGQLSVGRRPIVTPEALLLAIEAFRPRDPSTALAALYARWRRTTDVDHAAPWDAMVSAHPALAEHSLAVAMTHRVDAVPPAPPPRRPAPGAARVAPPAVMAGPTAMGTPTTARGRDADGMRRRAGPAAVLAVLVCVLLLGVMAWQGTRHRVANEGDVATTTVAPDRTAALSRDTAPAAAPTEGEIATRPGDGRGVGARPRRVLLASMTGQTPYSPSFDPHTNALIFHAGRDHTALLQASLRDDGSVGDVSTVREDGSRSYHAQVSPDGKSLAYDSDADGTRGVYLAHRDGSAPRRISGPGQASVPTWSPDGEFLAFARAEAGRPRVWNVWTWQVGTGELRRATSHRVGQPWGASWFPDSHRIAYSLEDRLIVHDLKTGLSRSYGTPLRGRLVRTPAVAPDGQRIVFQVYRDGAWLLDLRTGRSTRLLADALAQEFAWSPDGRRVAYHSGRGGEWGIWLLDVELGP